MTLFYLILQCCDRLGVAYSIFEDRSIRFLSDVPIWLLELVHMWHQVNDNFL